MEIVNNILVKVYNDDIKNGTIEIPNNVTSIGKGAFINCTSLKSINIPESIINIEKYTFGSCTSLKSINIPDSVAGIGEGAFTNCTSLKSINIPDSVAGIGEGAFTNCTSLKSINIPKSVTNIGEGTFENCFSLKEIIIPDGITSIGEGAFYNCKSLKIITVPESVTSIGDRTFSQCTNLTSIAISGNVVSIGKEAFNDCTLLKEVTLPKGLTRISNQLFTNCVSMKEITIPDNVTSIGENAFANCRTLKSIVIPNKVTSIGYKSFDGCIFLKSVIIPDTVINIGAGAFNHCTFLQSITIPKGVTRIRERTFFDCNSLERVILSDNITDIENFSFDGCRFLKEINLPSKLTRIGISAFSKCGHLKSVIIPDNVTSIGKNAFDGCKSLESITISKNIISINNSIFNGCKSLKTVNISENIISISENAFNGCNSLNHLITPYGSTQINNGNDIVLSYLYLYSNSILKEKYNNIDEFLENDYIKNLAGNSSIYTPDAIMKFKILFYKLRRNFEIGNHFFVALSCEEIKQFDYKIWNEIRDLVDTDNIEMAEVVSEMIAIFGLFENDNGVRGRLQDYVDFVNNKHIIFTDAIMSDCTKTVNCTYCQLKSGVVIPGEFNIDLTPTLTEKEMKNVKKLTGNYGKRINDFVKENYEIVHTVGYKVEGNPVFYENGNFVNYSTLHTMFDGCDKKFDIDFYNFFMKYIDTILKNEIYQRRVKDIQKNFQDIKAYYKLHAGIDDITLKQAINYVENMEFDNIHAGNIEFAKDVKKAGVVSQKAFEYYQKIYESNDKRRLTSLVKRSNIYEINGFRIKTELLRKDDSFGMLVGETNYTNCCQIFGNAGHNCLAHAVNSDDGGIFVTKLVTDEGEILLTESWDWQNNNVYCHDNIEGTPYFKNNKDLHDVVAKAIELDALEIIRKSKEEVEKYIIERKRKIEKSLLSSNEKDKQLINLFELENREVIRLVTVGSGNSDLKLSNYYHNTISVSSNNTFNHQVFTLSNFQPVNYNRTQVYFNPEKDAYSDAKSTQYIIAGSVEELSLGKLEPLVPIYRDERRIIEESKEDIRDYTLSKIKSIKYKACLANDINSDALKNSHVILGEDWYLIYEEKDNGIYITDLIKIQPSINDEKGIQNKEIMNSLNSLLETYDIIESDLKEDSSYLLFLLNKKLGYIEQIGEDTSYSSSNKNSLTIVSETDQDNILKNIKQIRQDKNPNLIMHHVKFKKKSYLSTKKLIKAI